MPTFFFPLATLTQIFEDQSGLSEALNFNEISRFDVNAERRQQAVRSNVEEILKRAAAVELNARIAPSEFETSEISLVIEPPNNSKRWRFPIAVKFHLLRWQQSNGYHQVFVPALGIAILSKDNDEFDEKIELEIRAALLRSNAAKSLRKLRAFERIREIRIEKSELAVEIKTPKQRRVDEDKEQTEKSALDEISTKLNDLKLPRAYEVETKVNLLAEILKSKQRPSVLLVGASGAGKTAVFEEFVRQRANLGFRETLFFATNGARLVAGQTGFGMWQERCQKLVAEAKKQKAILHLGNLVELLEVGKSTSNAQGIASFFAPKIARGELQVIVECTIEQLAPIEKRDANLLGAFQQIQIEEPDRHTNFKILEFVAREFAPLTVANNRETEALAAIQTLDAVHQRYATYSAFPGRPIRFLRNLLSSLKTDEFMSPDKVLKAFAAETGLPLFLLSEAEPFDLRETERWFEQKVIGQTAAVKLIVDLIATVKAKLTRPRKPIASLLFIGATGVGKTELTKTLAEFFFRNRERLVRFDMSEFSTPLAVQRLIGGTGEAEGLLTGKMREQPFSVLLFDEFEKAHEQFFDLLLQVLGEGRLTDVSGRVADFTNSIIVMTSNLGAETFGRGQSGFLNNASEKQAAVKHFNVAVRDFLRPEIYNRIDRIVPFAPLDEKTAGIITNLEIEKLKEREGLKFREIKLNLQAEVVNFLARAGYDVRYGARPLRRVIERELLAPLASELNQFLPDEKLTVNVSLTNNRPQISIETNAFEKKRQSANYILVTLANRAADLRRKAQKLRASHHLVELADEQFQLARTKNRADAKQWISPEDLARLARLPQIQDFLTQVTEFGQTTAVLEDQILLDIYGKAQLLNADFTDLLSANEIRLQKLLFDLLALKTEMPGEIGLIVFSENAAALFRLVRSYLVCAEDFGGEATEIVCFTTDQQKDQEPLEQIVFGREVWRQKIIKPEEFFAKTQKQVVGAGFKITGALANPRFAQENGIHAFIVGGATDKALVMTGDFSLAKLMPDKQLATRGAIDLQPKRRIYDAETNKIQDFVLNKTFEFDGRAIASGLTAAIAENLLRNADSLLD